ncbi:MAG: NosD domain-containing protein, partial [Xenococcus sp. (in: cyanobacteria)]
CIRDRAMTNEPSPVPIPQLPFGIKYHYCRLAIADFAPSDDPDDDNNEGTLNILQLCVLSFPPLTEIDPGECCCTIVVQPGEDIQAALDSLPPAGGCICLKTGIHEIRQPIRIEQSNLVLKGESPGTRVVRNNGTNLLIIAQPRNRLINDVVVEQIRFEAAGVDSDASELLDFVLIMVSNCLNVEIHHCRFEVAQEQQGITAGSKLPITPALGIAVVNSRQITLLDNTLLLTVIGIWAEGSTACDFSRNHIVGPILQLTDRLAVPAGYAGMLLNLFPSQDLLLEGDFLITDNLIQDFLLGIVAGVNSDRCKIINNQILREAVNQLPIEDFNNQFLAGSETYIYGIITYSANCSIAGNYLELNSPSYGGIRAFGNFTCIENNILQSSLTRELLSNSSQPPLSIFLGQISDNDDQLPALGLNGSVVKDNKLRGSLTGIGAVNVEGVEISENQIEISALVASLSIGIALASTHDSIVRSNQIRGTNMGIFLLGDPPSEGIYNRIINNHISDGNYGIGALSETALIVSGNQIENMTVAGFAAGNLIESACLTHNQIEHCGYQSPTEVGAGVFIVSVLGNLTLESCQIKNIGISRQGEVVSEKTFWGIAVGFVLACEIRNNEVYYSDIINLNKIALNRIHRALLIVGWIGSLSPDIPYPLAGNALVTNNVFQGIGFPHLVEFVKNVSVLQAGFEQVDFSHNQCFHLRTQANPPPIAIIPINIRQVNSTVATWGRNIVVMGNQVKADNSNLPSIDLSNPESVTLMGNIATGSIFNFGTGIIPANPENFNVFP